MITKKRIKEFGFPIFLDAQNFEFSFGNSISDKKPIYSGGYCNNNEAKFFIHEKKDNKEIFTMEFYICDPSLRHSPFAEKSITERNMRLQYIRTSNEYRKQGIATYYIEKLRDLCLENDIHVLTLNVAPSEKDTTNALNRDQLTKFYQNFNRKYFRIELI